MRFYEINRRQKHMSKFLMTKWGTLTLYLDKVGYHELQCPSHRLMAGTVNGGISSIHSCDCEYHAFAAVLEYISSGLECISHVAN